MSYWTPNINIYKRIGNKIKVKIEKCGRFQLRKSHKLHPRIKKITLQSWAFTKNYLRFSTTTKIIPLALLYLLLWYPTTLKLIHTKYSFSEPHSVKKTLTIAKKAPAIVQVTL